MKPYYSKNMISSVLIKCCFSFLVCLIFGCTNQNKQRNSILNDLFITQKTTSIRYLSKLKKNERLVHIQNQINIPSKSVYDGLIRIPDFVNQALVIPSRLINIQNDNSIPIQCSRNLIIIQINRAGQILLNFQSTPINTFHQKLDSLYYTEAIEGKIYISVKIQEGIEDNIKKQITNMIIQSMEEFYEAKSKRMYTLSIRELSEKQRQDFLTRLIPIIWYENFTPPPKPINS